MNVYYASAEGSRRKETIEDEENQPDNLTNIYTLNDKVFLKDYAKVFSYFFFYKIFRIKLYHDGLIQLCYPKVKRVYDNFMLSEVKYINIEGPKSLKITSVKGNIMKLEVS